MVRCLKRWHLKQPVDPFQFPERVRSAIHQQTTIGWRGLIEGLPAQHWSIIQQQYYSQAGSRRSGKRWLQGLLPLLTRLGRNQWLHRNHCKHKTVRKRHLQYVALLDDEIIHEYRIGWTNLLPHDQARFAVNLIYLLRKPLRYKKAWWRNLHQARQRYERVKCQNDQLLRETRASSRLHQWQIGQPR